MNTYEIWKKTSKAYASYEAASQRCRDAFAYQRGETLYRRFSTKVERDRVTGVDEFHIVELSPTTTAPPWFSPDYFVPEDVAWNRAKLQHRPVITRRANASERKNHGVVFDIELYERAMYNGYVDEERRFSDSAFFVPLSFDSWVETFRDGGNIADLHRPSNATLKRSYDAYRAAYVEQLEPAAGTRTPVKETPTVVTGNAELPSGMYVRNGDFYRVVHSKAGRAYAKKLNRRNGKYEYARGAIFNLRARDRATLEQVADVSRRLGKCCICGQTLTNARSVDAGIGPVCAKKI